MKISIVDRSNNLSAEAREFSSRRLLFALARFDNKIDFISLVLSDINGPRGGVDKRCKIRIKLFGEPEVILTDHDESQHACIARIADRSGRTVSRVLCRNQRDGRRRKSHKRLAFSDFADSTS